MDACYRRARDGDPTARSALCAALHPRLRRLAATYAHRCGEDADDLLQEAWTGLLEALPRLDPARGAPDRYLLRQARWRLLDAVRRNRLRRCEPLAEADLAPSPGDALVTAGVRAFVAGLPPTQRFILEGLLAGLTWREIGARLGCSSANVAYHVRRLQAAWLAWQVDPEGG